MSKDVKTEQEEELNVLAEQEVIHSKEPVVHAWVQRGSDLECNSCPHPHGQINAVPHGKMLIKNEKGEFDIVPIPGM